VWIADDPDAPDADSEREARLKVAREGCLGKKEPKKQLVVGVQLET
jgi:hypothetical protein